MRSKASNQSVRGQKVHSQCTVSVYSVQSDMPAQSSDDLAQHRFVLVHVVLCPVDKALMIEQPYELAVLGAESVHELGDCARADDYHQQVPLAAEAAEQPSLNRRPASARYSCLRCDVQHRAQWFGHLNAVVVVVVVVDLLKQQSLDTLHRELIAQVCRILLD